MIDKEEKTKQIIISVGVLSLIVLSFILIRNNFIIPRTKYYKITNYYAGTLKEKSNYNKYQLNNISAESLMNRLFNDFKYKMQKEPKLAYKLIDKNSNDNLFNNYKEFEQHITSTTTSLLTSKIVSYNIKKNSCIIMDQYNYKYTFKYTTPINYTVSIEMNNTK